MLLASETLIVVAFALKQLLEVGFAVKLAVQSCVAAQAAEVEQPGQAGSGLKVRGQSGRAGSHLSLVWQCLQQKQEL